MGRTSKRDRSETLLSTLEVELSRYALGASLSRISLRSRVMPDDPLVHTGRQLTR